MGCRHATNAVHGKRNAMKVGQLAAIAKKVMFPASTRMCLLRSKFMKYSSIMQRGPRNLT